MAHYAHAGLKVELFDLQCLRAPSTNDLEFHVKVPFKKCHSAASKIEIPSQLSLPVTMGRGDKVTRSLKQYGSII
jgi:hypothetical protein